MFFIFLCTVLAAPVGNETDFKPILEKRVTHSGRATWFNVGLGNCGEWNTNSDHIVAISKAFYDANDASNCNQWMQITDTKTGKTFYGQTRDSCQACGYYDIDLSPSLFSEFESLSVGVLSVEWNFMARGWSP